MRTLVVNALRLAGQRTAMGRYIEYLAHYWSRMEVPFDRIIFMSPVKVSMDHLSCSEKVEIAYPLSQAPFFVWEQCILPLVAKGAAMLFCPSYTCPLFYRGRMIVANHGIYETLPDEFSWWNRLRTVPLFRLSVQRAHRVIANSETTKGDLIQYFNVPESKIDVLYPGIHDLFFEPDGPEGIAQEVVRTLGKKVPYVLFVGKLSKRRHVPELIQAFSHVRCDNNLPHHLLVVGPNVSDVPIEELARRHGISDCFHYKPHLEQGQLARLYTGADLFVLPTTYEGISWTILEAMASGTAVLAVEHPTLREGAGDAVFAVPTPSVENLVKGLQCLLKDHALRQSYAEKGRERARKFSWQKVAQETIKILDQEANPSDR